MVRFIREVLFPNITTLRLYEFQYIYRRIHKLTHEEQYFLFQNIPNSALPRHMRVTDQYLYLYEGDQEPNQEFPPVLYTIYSPREIPLEGLSTYNYVRIRSPNFGLNIGGNFYRIHSDSHYTPPSTPPRD